MKPLLWQSINVCVFVFIGSSYPPSNFGDAAINKKLPISPHFSLHPFLLFFLFSPLEYFAMRKTIVLRLFPEEDLKNYIISNQNQKKEVLSVKIYIYI